jgi:DNA-binding response OmpR family regulator
VSHLVLIAEDEPNILESLRFLLEHAGLRIATAHDGAQAIRSIQELRPALVVLDVTMQHHSGFEVLKRVRADPELSATKVLILTAKGQEADRRTSSDLGADRFITKPFSNKELVAQVRELLDLNDS